MQIGRKLYYELSTGNIIVDTGERAGGVVETTLEQDFSSYVALSERNPDTVGCLQFEYGQYAEDFAQCNGYRIDPVSQQVLFSYPDPNEPEQPTVYRPPLTEQVEQLEIKLSQSEQTNLTLAEAIADLYELYLGAG